MVRIVIIMALLASLVYLVKHLQPVTEPVEPGKAAASRQERGPEEVAAEATGGFNPSVPAPLPDVNNGYVFSEKRKFEKDEPVEAGRAAPVDEGPDLLATVLYSGSVIVGDLRRALVTYQEQSVEAPSRRPAPGRRPAAPSPGAMRNKQLNQGDRFLGYVVAAIQEDRIVFEKGDRKVEKFLHDQNKSRMAPPEPSQREAAPTEMGGVPLQAMAPPEVLQALMSPSAPNRPLPGGVANAPIPGAGPPANVVGAGGPGQAPVPPNRVVRRSQRFLGIDSSTNLPGINVPVTPVPGLPVPNN